MIDVLMFLGGLLLGFLTLGAIISIIVCSVFGFLLIRSHFRKGE